ncbi:hypothetical protein [Streptomyces radicis]|uniref:Uncharacterized protein n=1 Tax=Streptomyces radicis TaxID=1750517 RepID=A0A3A9WMZ5_9ACTN|nr:hypothetical protein [Streptomyces radicis]RKN07537.1 hypothetical protein D7319_17840 [Streptomyces radicis]RKN13668.1 hypothetical protein D7318_30560 [Streptomyces radicis]
MSETPLEAKLRELLAERARDAAPAEAPVDTIVDSGRRARRRGRIALSAGAAVLVAVPGAAIAAQGEWLADGDTATAAAPAESEQGAEQGSGPEEAPPSESPAEPSPEVPQGPSDPERQLFDGVTLEQATASLESCLAEFPLREPPVSAPGEGSGETEFVEGEPLDMDLSELRIVLAWVSQGDENRGPEPMTQVVAVTAVPDEAPLQLVCAAREDGAANMQSGSPAERTQPVVPEIGAGRYQGPQVGEWTLPFRWADFGVVTSEVERVTVTYAGETEEAALDTGYYVAAGMAEQEAEGAPVVVGYDAEGEVVYDSREDATHGRR